MKTKRCSKCKDVRPLFEFGTFWSSKRGKRVRRSECRACVALMDRDRARRGGEDYRKRKLEAQRKYMKTPKGKRTQAKARRTWRGKHRDRHHAHSRADRTVRIEGLCRRCGKRPAEFRHHPDYSDPERVELLCRDCHYAEHGRRRPKAAGSTSGGAYDRL